MATSSDHSLRVALISMPWALFNRPSIQLGSLKAFLERESWISVDCFHPFLDAAKDINIDTYRCIAQDSWAGEALYAPMLFPEKSESAEKLFSRSLSPKRRNNDFKQLSRALEASLENWIASRSWDYDLVGFSVCFSQLLPSLAAAAALKKNHPHLPVVFGGSSCAGNIGPSLLANFSQIDHIINGEGETHLLALCRTLAKEKKGKREKKGSSTLSCSPIENLNSLPCPDYGDYFRELDRLFPGRPFQPVLPLEFSRGCWWNKCSFCNLNLQWQGYRWKGAERTHGELRHLMEKYGCLDFTFTDNALPPKEADSFFEKTAQQGVDLRFFAEIRVSAPEQISLYGSGGLRHVQVGIEALSTSLLQRLKKGTSTMDNLAVMKYCAEQNIRLDGNLITEFPGSTEDEVQETLLNLSYALPFHPLSSASFFLGMDSPVCQKPEQFGLSHIVNHRKYDHLFPKDLLSRLDLIVKSYRGDRQRQKKRWKPVQEKIRQWQAFHNNREQGGVAPLSYRDGGTFLIIRQEQIDGPPLIHRLKGLSRELYLFCASVRSLEEIEARFSTLPQKTVLNFFADLSKKRLLYGEKENFLALAIHSSQ